MRASLLARAIASTLWCRRFLAASIQDFSPLRAQERARCRNLHQLSECKPESGRPQKTRLGARRRASEWHVNLRHNRRASRDMDWKEAAIIIVVLTVALGGVWVVF